MCLSMSLVVSAYFINVKAHRSDLRRLVHIRPSGPSGFFHMASRGLVLDKPIDNGCISTVMISIISSVIFSLRPLSHRCPAMGWFSRCLLSELHLYCRCSSIPPRKVCISLSPHLTSRSIAIQDFAVYAIFLTVNNVGVWRALYPWQIYETKI